MAVVAPVLPANFFGYPIAPYSIAYDIFTTPNELDAPDGWHSPRSHIYRQLKRSLNCLGFFREQYSDYLHPGCPVIHVWLAMWALHNISLIMKFATTVRRIRMNRLDHAAQMDVTGLSQLGGGWITRLHGPVPNNLIPPRVVLIPVPVVVPAAVHVLPVGTRAGPGANNPNNWSH